MSVQFTVPSGPKRYSITLENFRGVDHFDAPTNVDATRSPECPNMIRGEVGKVRKRTGYHTVHNFGDGVINGVWNLRGGSVSSDGETLSLTGQSLAHVGQHLYVKGVASQVQLSQLDDVATLNAAPSGGDETPEIPGGDEVDEWKRQWHMVSGVTLNDRKSWGVQFQGLFYLLDGEQILVWDGKTLKRIQDYATVPTVIISASPGNGGGTRLQSFNLLSKDWYEQFKGEAGVTVYHMSQTELEAVVSVEVIGESGAWTTLTAGAQYTVDLSAGTVTFKTAPGAPQVLGTDNVKIRVRKDRGNQNRILGCRFGVLYGVNGAQDRLFLSGNPLYPNLDFYSEYNDPAYFADDAYCEVGQDEGRIMGYSVVGGLLATHRCNSRNEHNIVVRSGELGSSGKAVFRTVNSIQGEGAVSSWAFATLDSEPLFLTQRGVYAITAKEITGERISQMRSFYITPDLEPLNLDDAVAVVWDHFYVLAAGGRLYLLDGLQKTYSENAPNSSFQYECYYWTGIPATIMWVDGEKLCFGTSDGRLCEFYTDPDDRTHYNDDGKAIEAYWDTPDLDGHAFWRNKTFRYIACRLASAASTGVTILAQVKGLWRQIYIDRGKARYFDWNYVDMEHFTFSADRTPHTLGGKIKEKKVDKIRFRFRNDKKDESFGLYAIGLEYTEPGTRYKG